MKIEAIRKRLNKTEHGQVIGPFQIDIDHLSQDPTFQVRQRLDAGNVERLKSAYKAGREIVPITLAILPERPDKVLIVDGHHRVKALEVIAAEQNRAGMAKAMTVSAVFVRLSATEARWQAAAANMCHGQPITNKELRKAFQRYVEAKQHRRTDGAIKSYREIGREFGKTHPTIRTWMRKDFPQEAKQMKDDDFPANSGGAGIPAPVVLVKHRAMDAIKDISNCFDAMFSHEREEILDGIRSLLEDLERVKGRTDDFTHDDELMTGGRGEDGNKAPF